MPKRLDINLGPHGHLQPSLANNEDAEMTEHPIPTQCPDCGRSTCPRLPPTCFTLPLNAAFKVCLTTQRDDALEQVERLKALVQTLEEQLPKVVSEPTGNDDYDEVCSVCGEITAGTHTPQQCHDGAMRIADAAMSRAGELEEENTTLREKLSLVALNSSTQTKNVLEEARTGPIHSSDVGTQVNTALKDLLTRTRLALAACLPDSHMYLITEFTQFEHRLLDVVALAQYSQTLPVNHSSEPKEPE